MMPCRAWTPEGKQCYICNKNCDTFRGLSQPGARDLLDSLTCDPDCDRIVVTSSGPAAVWQNKRTGLFKFIGEHNGRPTYQNNATKEHLYYTFTGAEWLVGPDFRKPHAGHDTFQYSLAVQTNKWSDSCFPSELKTRKFLPKHRINVSGRHRK